MYGSKLTEAGKIGRDLRLAQILVFTIKLIFLKTNFVNNFTNSTIQLTTE